MPVYAYARYLYAHPLNVTAVFAVDVEHEPGASVVKNNFSKETTCQIVMPRVMLALPPNLPPCAVQARVLL